MRINNFFVSFHSITPAITAYYHQHIVKDGSYTLQRMSSFDESIEGRLNLYDYRSEERHHFDGDYWAQGLIIIGVLLGSAVFHSISAWCQKEEEDLGNLKADSQIEGLSIAEMRNLDLESAENFEEAKRKAQIVLRRKMNFVGAPGLTASVSVNGKTVWSEGNVWKFDLVFGIH